MTPSNAFFASGDASGWQPISTDAAMPASKMLRMFRFMGFMFLQGGFHMLPVYVRSGPFVDYSNLAGEGTN
jgi:hypothetical protein